MMKDGTLSALQQLDIQSATYIRQAMLVSPEVKPIGKVQIAHRCVVPSYRTAITVHACLSSAILSDIIFDSVFSEMALHGPPCLLIEISAH
jgi:hypothetical protein